MRRRPALLFIALSVGGCGSRTEGDFRLLRGDSKQAHIVDLAQVDTDRDGIRRVTVTSITESPVVTPAGRPGQYARIRYAFDCANLRYRGEGVTVYDAAFETLDEVTQRSPWRPVSAPPSLTSDFRRFCASRPSGADLPKVVGPDWRAAARSSLARLRAEGH